MYPSAAIRARAYGPNEYTHEHRPATSYDSTPASEAATS